MLAWLSLRENDRGRGAPARADECAGRTDHRQIQVTRQVLEGSREPGRLDQTLRTATLGVEEEMEPGGRRSQSDDGSRDASHGRPVHRGNLTEVPEAAHSVRGRSWQRIDRLPASGQGRGVGRSARVVVVSGPRAGESVDFKERLTIGRRPENGLSFRDEHMSRFHALIERRGDGFAIEDLSGKRRTRVDGRLVEGHSSLDDQARITLGRTILRFRLVDPPEDDADAITQTDLGPYDLGEEDPQAPPLPADKPMPSGALRTLPLSEGPLSESRGAANEEELRRVGKHLRLLLRANTIISTELDLEKLFERILDALFETFFAHRAAVLTRVPGTEELRVRATRVDDGDHGRLNPSLSSSIAYRAYRERVGVHTFDAAQDGRFGHTRSIVDQSIKSAICAPMVHQDEAFGVIYLDTVGPSRAFEEADLVLLNGIAAAAAGAVKNATLVARLKDTAADTIYRLALAAEQRDGETGYHIQRMADYAATIARALGRSSEYAETIRLAAPMHDVGKIGIPDSILKKPGRLTPQEFEVMKQHTVKGAEILADPQSDLLHMAQSIALSHHERYDGGGYPRELRQTAIPLEGRIVAVADVFDAVMSRRVYKPAFALEKSLDILERGRGRHFDPDVVHAFMSVQDEILKVRDRYAELEEHRAHPLGSGIR